MDGNREFTAEKSSYRLAASASNYLRYAIQLSMSFIEIGGSDEERVRERAMRKGSDYEKHRVDTVQKEHQKVSGNSTNTSASWVISGMSAFNRQIQLQPSQTVEKYENVILLANISWLCFARLVCNTMSIGRDTFWIIYFLRNT